MPTAAVSERPAKVLLAVILLYSAIGIAAIRIAIVVLRHLEVRTPDVIIMVRGVIGALCLFLTFRISKGNNWARWSLVAYLIVSIPLTFLPAIPTFSAYPVQGYLDALQFALTLIALGLLFHPNASKWFAKGGGSTRS